MKKFNITAKQTSQSALKGACVALLLTFTTSVYAQPVVTFDFDSMFGKKAFYDRGPNFDTNSIPPEGFNSPTGVAILSADRIIVADRGNRKLQSCDYQGDCFWIGGDASFGSRGTAGVFDLPHGVSVSASGSLIVADEDNHQLQICGDTGDCTTSGGTFSEDSACAPSLGKWCAPQDTAVDSLGQIYGLDTGNNRVQILRGNDLVVSDVFMRPGSSPGQLNDARGIAIDKNDKWYFGVNWVVQGLVFLSPFF